MEECVAGRCRRRGNAPEMLGLTERDRHDPPRLERADLPAAACRQNVGFDSATTRQTHQLDQSNE